MAVSSFAITDSRLPVFQVGVTNGKFTGVRYQLFKNAGYNSDCSPMIMDCALIHLDNSYYFPTFAASGKVGIGFLYILLLAGNQLYEL